MGLGAFRQIYVGRPANILWSCTPTAPSWTSTGRWGTPYACCMTQTIVRHACRHVWACVGKRKLTRHGKLSMAVTCVELRPTTDSRAPASKSAALADPTEKFMLMVQFQLSLCSLVLCACAGSAAVVKTAVAC
jgi:hypothetical protein